MEFFSGISWIVIKVIDALGPIMLFFAISLQVGSGMDLHNSVMFYSLVLLLTAIGSWGAKKLLTEIEAHMTTI